MSGKEIARKSREAVETQLGIMALAKTIGSMHKGQTSLVSLIGIGLSVAHV